jgi:uncharacterized protein (DUF58 family)
MTDGPDPASLPPSRAAATALAVTLALQMFTSLAATATSVLAPMIASDLGVSPNLIGVFVGIIYVGSMAGSLAAGGFVERFGAIRVSQTCVLLCAASLAAVCAGAAPPSSLVVLLALAPLALGIAMAFDTTLLAPMLAADGGLVLLALLDATLASGRSVVVAREPPAVLSVGRANAVRLQLRSTARRPLEVTVTEDRPPEVAVTDLPARATLAARGRATITYHLSPSRRGAVELGDHHVRYRSPLGLWQRQLRLPARHTLKVYPDVTAVRVYELLARQSRENLLVRAVRLRGGENEFERLREYGRDDEYRNIDWKATARRGRLIVREYQQERNQTVVCLLDCGRLMTAESDGLAQMDHALNAVLMLAHVAARGGDQLGLMAFDARVRAYLPPAGGRRAAQRVAHAMYDLHPSMVETDFEGAFAELTKRLRKRALVVLFTQVIDDVSAQAVLRQVRSLRPRHLPVCVLFRDPDLDRMAEPGPGLATAPDGELYVAAAAAETILWRERLVRDLKTGGALVLHVPPRQTTPAVINRYLQIKAQHLL